MENSQRVGEGYEKGRASMKNYNAKTIRNVALTGHAGSGKTSLTEAMCYTTGLMERLGRGADGNTISDFDPEEVRRQVSVSTSLVPIEWKGTKINILDMVEYSKYYLHILSLIYLMRIYPFLKHI